MVDLSLLAESRFDFIVVSDTHYMLAPDGAPLEMESRRRQSARAMHALRRVGSISAAFVVHLGDLVQEFPGMDGFEQSVAEALQQIQACGLSPRQVAGNHDVGDKPDPTMPTAWVSLESLARYHAMFGQSWYSWDEDGWHFVVLNSQIMNSGLPDEHSQQRWLESDLAAVDGLPVAIFLHLAPFLVDRSEPGLAHYDNIAEPARGWLLDLLGQHDVRLLFAGHSHFQFVNQFERALCYVVPSTSFTRPGFSEIFSSATPPERGRDDTAKLGFFLVRVHDDGPRMHLIRTHGAEEDLDTEQRYVVTRLPRDLSHSPLGVVARHPIAPAGEVPVAWPSLVRQPMRNDYPLLACVELGARHLRVPASDLLSATQSKRLVLLRDEGVQVTAVWVWSDDLDLAEQVAACGDLIDSVELQIPATLLPDPILLRSITRHAGLPVSITPLMPHEIVPGKQHARARIGYRVSELDALDDHLQAHDVNLDRIVVRVDPVDNPWDVMLGASTVLPLRRVVHLDWLVELATEDTREQSARVAEALFGAALQSGCRVFLDPLADLDRTMDVSLGLIDRMSNPHPAFNVARILNSLLFRQGGMCRWADHPRLDGVRCLGLASKTERYCLILPGDDPVSLDAIMRGVSISSDARLFDLERGTSRTIRPKEESDNRVSGFIQGPVLLAVRTG